MVRRVISSLLLAAATLAAEEALGQSPVTGPALEPGVACPLDVITEIEVRNGSVFDPGSTDSRLLGALYRVANIPHVRTRTGFIRSQLLLEEGDCADPFLVTESQRILEGHRFLASARIQVEDHEEGGKRLVVVTRDEWSLQLDVRAAYDDGVQLEQLRFAERNFAGRGLSTEVVVVRDRDRREEALRFSTPALVGRVGAGAAWGRGERGTFYQAGIGHPFVGDVGRFAFRTNLAHWQDAFVYSAGEGVGFTHLLLPAIGDQVEFFAARRLGDGRPPPQVGFSAVWRRLAFSPVPEFVEGGEFQDAFGQGSPQLPSPVGRQMVSEDWIRFLGHLAVQERTYREFQGLDGVHDTQTVGLGHYAGVSLGASVGHFGSGEEARRVVPQGRAQFDVTALFGGLLVRTAVSAEGRWNRDWQDLLVEASLAAYAQPELMTGHTFFFRGAAGGGWRTQTPFQLWLGGRHAVRSLREYAYPGGRILHFTLEDRVAFQLPGWAPGDLGMTLFADAGKIWAGDVPFGMDSGWHGGVGAGLRFAIPRGNTSIARADIVLPVSPGSREPIFRFYYEVNRLRFGFGPDRIQRSRRTDHF